MTLTQEFTPAAARSYYALFGLTPRYALDTAALEDSYRRLQGRVHPDCHARSGEVERRLAQQWASLANEAYRTLKSPIDRARYLLSMNRGGTGEETAAPPSPEPAFLMEQIELRESLAQARSAGDVDALQRLEAALGGEMAALYGVLATLLDETNDHTGALEVVQKLQFFDRLMSEVGDAFDAI